MTSASPGNGLEETIKQPMTSTKIINILLQEKGGIRFYPRWLKDFQKDFSHSAHCDGFDKYLLSNLI